MLIPPSASLRTRTAAFLEDEQLALDQDCELEHRRTGPELDHRGRFVVEGPRLCACAPASQSASYSNEKISLPREGLAKSAPMNMGPSSRTQSAQTSIMRSAFLLTIEASLERVLSREAQRLEASDRGRHREP